jgi:RND family efflux transporter MFP subunit
MYARTEFDLSQSLGGLWRATLFQNMIGSRAVQPPLYQQAARKSFARRGSCSSSLLRLVWSAKRRASHMSGSIAHSRASDRLARTIWSALVLSALLVGCRPDSEAATPPVRPVRTVTVEKHEAGSPVTLTGRIEAKDEVALGFRISGRLLENKAKLGDRVKPGEVIARLEPQNELNQLRSAEANLAAAQAQLTQAQNHFERQNTLLQQGWTTRAIWDQAKKALQTAQAQADSAEAQLKAAHDLVSFTQLEADAPGVVTEVGPRSGTVVQAGQMIVRLARQDGRDAVFDVPAQLIRSAPPDPQIMVSLTDDPKVTAQGRVREVAPQADPVTRNFEVKVGLTDPPPAMLLGATVTGRMEMEAFPVINIPTSALTRFNQRPAVWIVDSSNLTVSVRNVEVVRYDPATVAVSEGLNTGDIVVTAGVQALHPGQKVRLLGSPSS